MGTEVIYHNDPADPLFGQTTTVVHPDPQQSPSEQKMVGRATHEANIRARAATLRKQGKHVEALSLLSTIGG